MKYRYRYCINTAYDCGINEHPQRVIRRYADDACEFEPIAVADCWIFSSDKELTDEFFKNVTCA